MKNKAGHITITEQFVCCKALKLVISKRLSVLITQFTAHSLCTLDRILNSLQLLRVLLNNVFLVLLKLSVLLSHRSTFFCGGGSTVRTDFFVHTLQHSNNTQLFCSLLFIWVAQELFWSYQPFKDLLGHFKGLFWSWTKCELFKRIPFSLNYNFEMSLVLQLGLL